MRTTTKIILATGAFALVHSALASRPAKKVAARAIGQRNFDASYRLFFNVQSIISFAALAIYIRKLPNRKVWDVSKPIALTFNAIRLSALFCMLQAARQIGVGRLTGVRGWTKRKNHNSTIAQMPEAQGPLLEPGSSVTGPFRYTRHPMNFLALPLIWLAPRMTNSRFAFNCFASIYFVLGSLHEEHRLRIAYGQAYEQYRGETRFFFGRKKTSAVTAVSAELPTDAKPALR